LMPHRQLAARSTRLAGVASSVPKFSRPAVLAADRILNLGFLLYSFLDYFGRRHRYGRDVLCVDRHGSRRRSKQSMPAAFRSPQHHRGRYDPTANQRLSVLSPCDPGQDIGKNSYRVLEAKRAFALAATTLEARVDAFEHQNEAGSGKGKGQNAATSNSPTTTGSSSLMAVLALDRELQARG